MFGENFSRAAFFCTVGFFAVDQGQCHGLSFNHACSMDKQTSRPCPSCGKYMQLKRVIPGLGGLPQTCVYSCQFCGVSLTEADESQQHRSTAAGPTG
jgi:hypothetical protein